MSVRRGLLCAGLVVAAFLVLLPVMVSAAEEEGGFSVQWGPNCETLTIRYTGGEYQYPRDMLTEVFPPPGDPPHGKFGKEWPIIIMWSRWTESMENFPAKYRPHALDLALMFACDAQLYENAYPDVIRSSKFTYPPEFTDAARQDLSYNLVEKMRGKAVQYEVAAKAGFAMADYTIKTKILVGSSADGKTFFFNDRPEYISDYLDERDFFFAAHDAGDRIEYEAIMVCVCKPRGWFKDETLNRIKETGRYFVERLYACLKGMSTEGQIERYLALIRDKSTEGARE
ncbi:MAG: hypothetical protein PHE61_07110 [Candidatus Omnitrophica bacterium]|nr:hypothetical protein [Candidatus Omnitrophota bacterium]